MTVVPPPASPCLKVQLGYDHPQGIDAGSRFFLSYSGSAPTAANCATLAGDIETAWTTNLASLVGTDWTLDLVDVLDIATSSGASGSWSGTSNGTRSGDGVPWSVATNVQFNIARRYRGGKPKMYLPPGVYTDLSDGGHWDTTYTGAVETGVAAFFTAIAGLTIGAIGTLAHVNLSYYSGFKNITNSSGRERAVPQYRTEALLDTITGYTPKREVSSQRRRRVATTP